MCILNHLINNKITHYCFLRSGELGGRLNEGGRHVSSWRKDLFGVRTRVDLRGDMWLTITCESRYEMMLIPIFRWIHC